MAHEKLREALSRATNELLKDPDWGANTEVYDRLNRRPELGAQATAYLRKKMNPKKAEVALLVLTLVDGMVKNCPSMHPHVAHADFMKAVVKLTEHEAQRGGGLFRRQVSLHSVTLRSELRERALVMIQSWGKSFAKSRSFPIFYQTYQRLLQQGVQFPEPNADETAPVFTPPVHVPKARPPERREAGKYTDPECAAAGENALLLFDMLSASEPAEDLRANDLVHTLVNNCRSGQALMMQRIQGANTDAVMAEILDVNDKLLESLRYYEGLLTGEMERWKPAADQGQGADADAGNGDEDSTDGSASDEGSAVAAPGGPVDLLGLGGAPPPAAQGARPEKAKKEKRHKKKPSVVPTLAPPPGEGKKDKKKKKKRRSRQNSDDGDGGGDNSGAGSPQPAQGQANELDLLGDLLGLGGPAPAAQQQQPPQQQQQQQQQQQHQAADPFDMFAAAPAPAAAPVPARQTSANDDDEFMALAMGNLSTGAPQQQQQQQQQQQPQKPAEEVDEFDLLAGR